MVPDEAGWLAPKLYLVLRPVVPGANAAVPVPLTADALEFPMLP